MYDLREYQALAKEQIYKEWRKDHKNVLLVLPTGGGKCLGEDTPVLMFDGTIKKVQDVQPNDKLMGPDSKSRRVKSTCHGVSELFKITPVKGASWVCNADHILTLKHTQVKNIIDIPLKEYLYKSKDFKHLHKQFRVGVDFKSKPVQFDPYLIGLYIAEGGCHNNNITTPEPEIKKYLEQWCRKNNIKIRVSEGRGCETLHFSDFTLGWNKNLIKKIRKSCTEKNNRWIPREYLVNNREIRLQLLAGLLDGDGYFSHGGYEIITKHKQLNDDILFLARSLGFAAYSKIKTGRIKSLDFERDYYRINISGDLVSIPARVERKKPTPRKQIKDVRNTGFSVESIGEGDYYGFTLEGDGRFLLGDFTVTHNTVTFCDIAADFAVRPKNKTVTAIMVHRKELVQQISLTLSGVGITHNIIAPRKTIKGIVAAQRRVYGKQFYNYMAPISVISVDTLNARIQQHMDWAKKVRFWITDEAAHVLRSNKWGRALEYFPNAIGLGVTATPERLDKKGLGRHADGVFDSMVQGPTSRWFISNKYLCEYKVAVPNSDYEDYLPKASNNSDYSKPAMIKASKKSRIVGDTVLNYLKFAKGKQAIYFATDINTGERMEKEFLDAGVSAKLLTGLSTDKERLDGVLNFQEKKINVLINIDLFDEGFDVPGIECVGMARPTMSLSKYLQMVGRGLRPAKNKEFLILIDHVGNVKRHGLPCKPRQWTLDRIGNKRPQSILRICQNPECASPFDRALTECPWCGWTPKPRGNGEGRIPPEQVDGDLTLMDPKTLEEMESGSILESPDDIARRVGNAAGAMAGKHAAKKQLERIETQKELALRIADWAGRVKVQGYNDREIHKKFFLEYGKTIAQCMGEPKAKMLKTIDRL